MKTYRFPATAFAFISMCAGASAPMSASAVETYYAIKVEGGPDSDSALRLNNFYQRLLAELKVSDLGYADVGCDKCAELDKPGPAITSLNFAMVPDAMTLAAFALSYHYVQTNWHHDLFKITIDGTAPASPLCPSPLPTGCGPRPICIQTSSCDKPYGGTCAKCQ